MLPLKPCLPTRATAPPAGPDWLHEIKHDGYRMIARWDGDGTRLVSRHGATVEALAVRSCTIDGEVIACRDDGLGYRRRIPRLK